jgi:hypothetical protein
MKNESNEKRFTYIFNLAHATLNLLADKNLITFEEASELVKNIDKMTNKYFDSKNKKKRKKE